MFFVASKAPSKVLNSQAQEVPEVVPFPQTISKLPNSSVTAGSGSRMISADDERYTLTPEEKEEVRQLKEDCEAEDIEYRSIFELAKFCLVVSSEKDPKKRRKEALSRIKKKRQFEQKYNLDAEEFNIFECVKVLEENMPNWALPCGKVDGKMVIGYSSENSSADILKIPNGFEIICKEETTRYDLAAVDLEEARNGFYLVGTAKDLKMNPFAALKMATNLRVLYDKMNANRIKGIFFEVPSALNMVSNLFLNILPSKMKQRVNVGKNLSDLKFFKTEDNHAAMLSNLPAKLGGDGSYKRSLQDWFKERLELRNLSDELVTL